MSFKQNIFITFLLSWLKMKIRHFMSHLGRDEMRQNFSLFYNSHLTVTVKVFFSSHMRDLFNYNFIIIDKFPVLYGPWGLKQRKTPIFCSHLGRAEMRQLATFKTPARGLRILSNIRILVPKVGEEKKHVYIKNVNSPFKGAVLSSRPLLP